MPNSFENLNCDSVSQVPVLVSFEDLSLEALSGIIESFILREGTDYGAHEVSYEKKVEQVLKKIQRKEYLITFDPESESVTILTQLQWNDLKKGIKNVL